jgi:cell division protein FtsI (penicillin-binding protein 3)
MANYPTYDPNKYPPFSLESARNRAIHYNFEPGSTFKIVTALAALEANQIALNETFDCGEGIIHLAGKTIRDHKKFGWLTFPEIIQYSSNVGAIKIGQLVGENFFFKKIKAYGFGERTGIDLPGEEKGIFRKLSDWSRISLASLSFGQEISVTAVQLLQTMNIIANRGLITNPKMVKKILLSKNEARERPSLHKRVLSKKAASAMIEILERVVKDGTGTMARINGFRIAGKTGTAQKFDPKINAYSSVLHTSSFVGFAPVDKPAFSMIVVIDEPQGAYLGGEVAAPLFRQIAQRLFLYLRIPPQKEGSQSLITARLRREH